MLLLPILFMVLWSFIFFSFEILFSANIDLEKDISIYFEKRKNVFFYSFYSFMILLIISGSIMRYLNSTYMFNCFRVFVQDEENKSLVEFMNYISVRYIIGGAVYLVFLFVLHFFNVPPV